MKMFYILYINNNWSPNFGFDDLKSHQKLITYTRLNKNSFAKLAFLDEEYYMNYNNSW